MVTLLYLTTHCHIKFQVSGCLCVSVCVCVCVCVEGGWGILNVCVGGRGCISMCVGGGSLASQPHSVVLIACQGGLET